MSNIRLNSCESAPHVRAKNKMARWLARAAEVAGADPEYQVVIEYPFSAQGDGVESWLASGFDRKPTVRQLRARGMAPLYICDIAVIKSGRVQAVVEVVCGHYTPPAKVDWLARQGIAVYEAHASVILAIKFYPASFDDILFEVKP